MITNATQKVDQDKYGESFDRIFRKRPPNGSCQDCGQPDSPIQYCPYGEEILHEYHMMYLCKPCYLLRAMDI